MSKFKSSIYCWLSLFLREYSSTSFCFSLFFSVISSISFSFFSLLIFIAFWFSSAFACSFFKLSILFCIFSIFSSIDKTLCFSVAYVISISCNCFSWLSICSIIFSDDSKYSSFSFSNFFTSSSSFFTSFCRFSISLLRPKILTVFLATEPPVIAPDGFIISPSSVIILNEYVFSFATFIAFCILSTTTVLPNKFNIICSYFLLNFTKSDAIPITPIFLPLIFSNFLPLTDVIGRNDALPKLFFLKYSINLFASSSVSVTMF